MTTNCSVLGAFLLALATLLGCGYGLVGTTSNLPEDIRNIYVAPLENRTSRAQVDQLLTQAISQEFLTRQRFAVVNSEDEADAVLEGAVTSFNTRPVTLGTGGRAREYELILTVQMAFKRVGEDKAIWQQDRYEFRENYELDITAADYIDRENQAIEEIAPQFAQTLVIDLLEGF